MCKFRQYDNYEVYEDGRIWSYRKNKFLKPNTLKSGYQTVCLVDNEGNKKWYLLHRVIYEAVKGSTIPENLEVNHISENKTENFFANLELVSHKENINFGTGIKRSAKSKSKQVGAFNKNGELVMTFQSTQEAGRNGFDPSNVSACCRGKLKTHKGFNWKYL